jgi:ABC-type multidrug transport system ATPase subunit
MAMTISLSDAGKRFNREWIFRHLTFTFQKGGSYAITGPNGSGKSTLLQAIGGSMHINEGKIQWAVGSGQSAVSSQQPTAISQQVAGEKVYSYISMCAPYLDVIEEMTLKEFLDFHHGFKPFLKDVTTDSIITHLGLQKAADKQIRYYSSGMKQRVKLAQCIFSDTPVVLLDEPCTNLDAVGIELYHQLINDYCKDRLVVVSSNDVVEYRFCREKISISEFK